MIHARRGRTGRRGRQRTGQRLHPSTAKPRRSEEPVETVLTTGAEADRAESGTGPLPSTEERRPTDEPKETATERPTGTDVEAKAGRGLNPFKRRRRGRKRPKQPKPLGRYFPIARVNDETVGLLGGVEVSVMEVRGVEVEQPLVAAFAGVLNALDFTVQLLVRQHPPRLGSLREAIAGQRPDGLAKGVAAAADSLDGFLVRLEGQTGVVDRRFYAVCERSRSDELHGLISRAGFSVFPLRDRALTSFVRAALSGCAPPVPDEEGPLSVTLRRNRIEIGGRVLKTLHLTRWPRSLPPGYLQTVLSLGIPMDVSLHVSSIATAQAARTLEWQKVKMESAASLSLRRGRTAPPEAEIALQDVARLRDQVHRGRERLFHASLSMTVYADSAEQLKERELALRGLFAGALASLDRLAFRQHEGHLSTLPLAMNAIAAWRTLDTTSVAMLMPFAPPDLDTRRGTLFGLDLRSGSPVTFDAFDGAFLNANTVVMARSGAGKSFSMKLGLLRGITRGIVYYVIDPEGEYSSIAEAAGGRVLTPGVPGHGLNPFVVEHGDEGEVLQRVGGLRRLIEVMVGERLSPEQRATLDQALTAYYTGARTVTGFHDFFRFLETGEHQGFAQMASLLRPFSTGSLRHLLTDEGADLLGRELPITVFNLRLLEPELRPAATLVCAEAVWGMASRDPRPRVLVVDEVWSIMQHPEGASFLVSLAKRARKHKLGLISITQDVQDFLGEDTSRAIVGHSGRVLLQNSAFKLLLQQDAAALAAVAESFDLSASDVQWLLSAPRGDGMLIARGGRFPVRVLATPEEHRLIDAVRGTGSSTTETEQAGTSNSQQ